MKLSKNARSVIPSLPLNKKIFIFFIYCWIVFAFLNVFYNSNKLFSEIREWGFLSDAEKRHKLFGDYHDFFTLIKDHTKGEDTIFVFANGGEEYHTYFLSIYYLYPRKIVTTIDKEKFSEIIKAKKYSYIAAYNYSIQTDAYVKTASFSGKTSTNYGSFFKLK